MIEDKSHKTSWERADSVIGGAERAANGIGYVLTKIWGLVLLVLAVIVFIASPGKGWWVAILLGAYGIYLLTPGSKFVVW